MDAHTLVRAAADDEAALEAVSAALKRQPERVAAAAAGIAPAETARLLLRLRPARARALVAALPETPSLNVFAALDPDVRGLLLDDAALKRFARIAAKLPVDDAADMLADAPAALTQATLARLADPEPLRAALDHRADSAGAAMRRRMVAAPADWTIGRLIEEIRAASDRIDRLHALFVVDAERRPIGQLKLRDLLLNPPDTPLSAIMRPDIAVVSASADREDAARLAEKTNAAALPVVDARGRLIGRITPRELRAIHRAEAEEDMKLGAGLPPEATAADGPAAIVRRRLPWLAAGLVGASVAALVIGGFEDALAQAAVLATLIPIVMSLAGNAGIQASTVTVQALADDSLWIGDFASRLLREVAGGLANGLLVGTAVALGVLALSQAIAIADAPGLALTALLSLTLVTTQAAAVGAAAPLLLRRLGADPAVATGVFITTANDVVGVLALFVIASAVYL